MRHYCESGRRGVHCPKGQHEPVVRQDQRARDAQDAHQWVLPPRTEDQSQCEGIYTVTAGDNDRKLSVSNLAFHYIPSFFVSSFTFFASEIALSIRSLEALERIKDMTWETSSRSAWRIRFKSRPRKSS